MCISSQISSIKSICCVKIRTSEINKESFGKPGNFCQFLTTQKFKLMTGHKISSTNEIQSPSMHTVPKLLLYL